MKYAKSSKKYVIIYVIINVVTIPLSVVAPMLSAQLILDLTGNKLEQLLYTALVVLAIDLVRQILRRDRVSQDLSPDDGRAAHGGDS